MFLLILSLLKPSLFYDMKFAVVICNINIILVVNCKDISPYRYPRLPWYLCDIALFLGCVDLKSKHMGKFLTFSSFSAFMLTQQMGLCASSLVLLMPIWFRCSCYSALSCNDVGTIIIILFMSYPPMIAISSQNNQYSCSSFCTLACVDCQPQSTCSDRMSRCSLSRVDTPYLFSCCHTVWYVCAWLHCIDGYAHTWYFFISVSWLFLDS